MVDHLAIGADKIKSAVCGYKLISKCRYNPINNKMDNDNEIL